MGRSREEEVRHLLLTDHEYYARHAVKIVDKQGHVVPFEYKDPQRRFARLLEAQRERGEPMRGIVLKARQIGFSTQAQAMLMQRTTQIPNHHSMVIAHELESVDKLFKLGKGIYNRLPDQIRPPSAYENNSRGRQYLNFGEPAKQLRAQGIMGLDSSYTVATAARSGGGRSATLRTVHMSEVGLWPSDEIMLGTSQAVPDDPDTLIVVESTAYGENHFFTFWNDAVGGENDYIPFFTPWFEDPDYRRRFANEVERAQFERTIGRGPKREDEVKLIPLIRAYWAEFVLDEDLLEKLVLEILNWRLWAIGNKTQGDLNRFHQEYPSTPEEAFLSTGRKAFGAEFVGKVRERVEETSDPRRPSPERPGPALGTFRNDKVRALVGRNGAKFIVPQAAVWVPAREVRELEGEVAHWRRWRSPVQEAAGEDGRKIPQGQYIVSVDPMSGEENEGTLANHAIVVIDHRTLEQVAEYESQADPDLVAYEALRAALYFNRAWIAVEITGGWGYPIVRRIAKDFHYPRVWTRENEDQRVESLEDRLGWSTDSRTKPQLLARGQMLLREGTDGIRSRVLAQQLGQYVIDERGRSGPAPKARADVLMAWLIGQEVAARRPVRPERSRGAISTTGALAVR